ncbi:hypothetical protein CAPTEDRAFT_202948 [Capitella teleta]|uniref:G-protein coupled receptors family 1 profile domain-containing protein n=1 Tax=Capitella teleta TaxID=283909 RepID=R7U8J9_CAPTE|nr:hypothetical protein CAPTEDRAFT_202948 [Capitella teleta]|eukprot:ELT99435.1 hypothetical protein CAPTEDRAFT_202948 [Capitella teleta]
MSSLYLWAVLLTHYIDMGDRFLFRIKTPAVNFSPGTTELTPIMNQTETTHFVYGCIQLSISSFGIISNILLFIMMLTRELRLTVHGVLLGCVAAVNVMMSSTVGVYGMFLLIGRSDDLVACVVSSVNRGLRSSLSYLICLVSLERTLQLYFPLSRHNFCSPNKARVSAVLVVIVCLLLEIPANLKISLEASAYLDVPMGLLFCPENSRMTSFHVVFSYAVPIINIFVNGVLLTLKLTKRNEQIKKNVRYDSDHFKVIIERIQDHNQLTSITLGLFVHFALTSIPPMVIHLLELFEIPKSTLGVQAAEILTNSGHATILATLVSSKYFRRTFYQVLCIRDVHFVASFNRSKTEARRKAQAHLQCELPDHRKTCYRVVGLRLSSEFSSSQQAQEETVTERDGAVSVISGVREAASPTEVILTETALKLSNLGATYLN